MQTLPSSHYQIQVSLDSKESSDSHFMHVDTLTSLDDIQPSQYPTSPGFFTPPPATSTNKLRSRTRNNSTKIKKAKSVSSKVTEELKESTIQPWLISVKQKKDLRRSVGVSLANEEVDSALPLSSSDENITSPIPVPPTQPCNHSRHDSVIEDSNQTIQQEKRVVEVVGEAGNKVSPQRYPSNTLRSFWSSRQQTPLSQYHNNTMNERQLSLMQPSDPAIIHQSLLSMRSASHGQGDRVRNDMEVVMSGWVWRRSSYMNWKKSFAALHRNEVGCGVLYCFNEEKDVYPLKSFDLNECVHVQGTKGNTSKHRFEFKLVFISQSSNASTLTLGEYYFGTETQEQLQKWISALSYYKPAIPGATAEDLRQQIDTLTKRIQILEEEKSVLQLSNEKLKETSARKIMEDNMKERELEKKWKRDKESKWKEVVEKWQEMENSFREQIQVLSVENDSLQEHCQRYREELQEKQDTLHQLTMELSEEKKGHEETKKKQQRSQAGSKLDREFSKVNETLETIDFQQRLLCENFHKFTEHREHTMKDAMKMIQRISFGKDDVLEEVKQIISTTHNSIPSLQDIRQCINDELYSNAKARESSSTEILEFTSKMEALLTRVSSLLDQNTDVLNNISNIQNRNKTRTRTRSRTSTAISLISSLDSLKDPPSVGNINYSSNVTSTLHHSLLQLQNEIEHNSQAHKDTFQKLDSILKVADFVNTSQCQLMNLFAEYIQTKKNSKRIYPRKDTSCPIESSLLSLPASSKEKENMLLLQNAQNEDIVLKSPVKIESVSPDSLNSCLELSTSTETLLSSVWKELDKNVVSFL